MLTLAAMVGLTDPSIARNIQRYTLAGVRASEDSGMYTYKAYVYGGTKTAYPMVRVQRHDPTSLAFVSCTCTFFTMNCETALALRGSAAPVKAGGAYPAKRNPKLRPGLCPHLYLLTTTVLRAWKMAREKVKQKKQKITDSKLQSFEYTDVITGDTAFEDELSHADASDTTHATSVSADEPSTGTVRINPRLRGERT